MVPKKKIIGDGQMSCSNDFGRVMYLPKKNRRKYTGQHIMVAKKNDGQMSCSNDFGRVMYPPKKNPKKMHRPAHHGCQKKGHIGKGENDVCGTNSCLRKKIG